MTGQRKEDGRETRSWFRSDRMFQEGNKWFFLTREGSVEGPYGDRFEAARMLDAYVMVMNSSFSPARVLSMEGDGATTGVSPEPAENRSESRSEKKNQIPAFSMNPIIT